MGKLFLYCTIFSTHSWIFNPLEEEKKSNSMEAMLYLGIQCLSQMPSTSVHLFMVLLSKSEGFENVINFLPMALTKKPHIFYFPVQFCYYAKIERKGERERKSSHLAVLRVCQRCMYSSFLYFKMYASTNVLKQYFTVVFLLFITMYSQFFLQGKFNTVFNIG